MTTFTGIGLHSSLVKNLHEQFGFFAPQKVQKATIPLGIEGRDLLVQSSTGSGKTLGFLLPVIHQMLVRRDVGGILGHTLIISPTKVLADQTLIEAERLLFGVKGIKTAFVIGGGSKSSQEKELRMGLGAGGDNMLLILATPKRLIDFMSGGGGLGGLWKKIRWLVFDECDQLLDAGFRHDIDIIVSGLPKARQTMLFTATLPSSVVEAVGRYLDDDYVHFKSVSDQKPKIDQYALVVKASQVYIALWHILVGELSSGGGVGRGEGDGIHRVIVFFPAVKMVAFMAKLYRDAGFEKIYEIHSGIESSKQTKNSDAFREGGGVMMATDAVARGVDFPEVSLVVMCGVVPVTQYEHRIGRTGRAGKSGRSLIILAEEEKKLLEELRKVHKVNDWPGDEGRRGRGRDLRRAIRDIESNSVMQKMRMDAARGMIGSINKEKGMFKWKGKDVIGLTVGLFRPLGLVGGLKMDSKTLQKMGLGEDAGSGEGVAEYVSPL